MINVMIVDDELEIRKGLYLKADWSKLGFQIVAEAANGSEAMEKLQILMSGQESNKIEVVITDMNMPVMDGVGLLSCIHEQFPELKAVVLTGYDDFAYTKAAIRHRAVEYLLKPVMSDELEQVLLQLKKDILTERNERFMRLESSRMHQRWFQEIRENFALHMLKGDCSPMIMSKASSIQIEEWNTSTIQVITVGLQNADVKAASDRYAASQQTEQFQLPFELMTREFSEQYLDQLFICKDNNYPNLIHLICRDSIETRKQIIERYEQQLKQYLSLQLVIGVSTEVTGFEQWHHAYMDALLQWNLLSNRNYHDTAYQGHISKLDDDMLRKLLQKEELTPALQYIATIFDEASKCSQTEFVRRIFEVLISLDHILQEQRQVDHLTHSLWLNPEQVLKLTSVEKAVAYVEQVLSQSHRYMKAESNEDIFEEVLAYIKQNYAYEITLPSLAERFNYNASYFSELFKSKVGQSFVQYLQEIRMKHACRLLETTDLGLSDIAELTGFSNASYFSSRFKKIFNISPSDYRSGKGI